MHELALIAHHSKKLQLTHKLFLQLLKLHTNTALNKLGKQNFDGYHSHLTENLSFR